MTSFNPRPPCGERLICASACLFHLAFQSRPSLRRATQIRNREQILHVVSIHALLAESDLLLRRRPNLRNGFQSTPSLRRATTRNRTLPAQPEVSIHALLAESDWEAISTGSALTSFNPRPPCGERLSFSVKWEKNGVFQSTPSLRRATASTVHVVNQSCK